VNATHAYPARGGGIVAHSAGIDQGSEFVITIPSLLREIEALRCRR